MLRSMQWFDQSLRFLRLIYRDQSWDWSLRSISGYRDYTEIDIDVKFRYWSLYQSLKSTQSPMQLLICRSISEINIRDWYWDQYRDWSWDWSLILLYKTNLCIIISLSVSESIDQYQMLIFDISEIDTKIGDGINLCIDHKINLKNNLKINLCIDLWDWYRDSIIGLLSKLVCLLTPQDHTWSLRLGEILRAKLFP